MGLFNTFKNHCLRQKDSFVKFKYPYVAKLKNKILKVLKQDFVNLFF